MLFIFMIFQTVRRLHDINRSGWWWPVTLITIDLYSAGMPDGVFTIPLPFGLVLDVILCIVDGTSGPNQYGEDPLGREPKVQNLSSGNQKELNSDSERKNEEKSED